MGLKNYFNKKSLERENKKQTQKFQSKLDLEKLKLKVKQAGKEMEDLKEKRQLERQLEDYKAARFRDSKFGRVAKKVNTGFESFSTWAAKTDKKISKPKKKSVKHKKKTSSDDLFGFSNMKF